MMGKGRCLVGVAWGTSLAICGLALALVPTRDAGASDRRGADTVPSLELDVEKRLQVGENGTVSASGVAPPGFAVWAFVDPKAEACASAPSSQPERAIALATAVPVSGAFVIYRGHRPEDRGLEMFCAYLGRSADLPNLRKTAKRKVAPAFLRAAVARRTVVIALRRHGFAERTIDALEQRCRRRDRAEFACRFSARFPGYKLSGRGPVSLEDELSYRFRVRAQGVNLVLTDENEERPSE